MKFILFLSLPLYALDQWSKQLVLRFIGPYEAHTVVPDFFSLVNVTNTGARSCSSDRDGLMRGAISPLHCCLPEFLVM